jgi:hypothetical protein
MPETKKHWEFWMVYGQHQRAPAAEHMTEARAIDEAKRLSRVSPGTKFFVLKAVRGYMLTPPEPPPLTEIEIDPDEIPF